MRGNFIKKLFRLNYKHYMLLYILYISCVYIGGDIYALWSLHVIDY